ncbi:MAG: transcriptional regulator [Acidimicrobiales bacterium]
MPDDDIPVSYAKAVGDRLRNVRRQQRLSLLAVEETTGREFKASVLGAYERGERIISVLRLQRLAEFYSVPVDQLLPRPAQSGAGAGALAGGLGRGDKGPPVTIDLVRLAEVDAPERDVLSRYVATIQLERGDFNGRVITIRAEDVRSLGRVLERGEADMRDRLRDLGVLS